MCDFISARGGGFGTLGPCVSCEVGQQPWGWPTVNGSGGAQAVGGGLRAGLHSKRMGGRAVIGQVWGQQIRGWCLWLLGQPELLDRHLASCWVSAGDACPVSSWPCPSQAGKGRVLPTPTEFPPLSWPGLWVALVGWVPNPQWCWHLLGTQAPGPAPDGAGHLGVASPGPGWLQRWPTSSLLQPRLGSPCSPQA